MQSFVLVYPKNATQEDYAAGPALMLGITQALESGAITSPLGAQLPPGWSVQLTGSSLPVAGSRQQKPSVGRIVHYTAYNGTCLAMLLTSVNPDKPGQVHGVVFTALPNFNGELSGGVQTHFNVPHSESKTPGTWHWPERED